MEDAYSNPTLNTSSVNTTNASVTQSAALGFPEYLYQPLEATVFQITLWSTIVLLGVIGNLLVCIAILGRAKMKTSMNYYLLSLTIADLGVLLMIFPVAVLKYLSPFHWLLGKHACLYMVPTEEIFYGASIWSITAIAIERYRNIVGSKRYQFRNRSRSRTVLVIIAVWVASFLVSSVPLYPIMVYNSKFKLCYPKWPDMSGTNALSLSYSIALIVVWYALPLAVIAFTYLKIKKRVRDSVVFRTSMSVTDEKESAILSQSSQNKEKRAKRIWRQSNKAKRILTPLVILFAVTMFPLNALRVLLLIMPNFWRNPYYNLIMGQVIMFVMINSSANPLLYYITSNEFKDAFKIIFKSLREKKNFLKRVSSKSRASSRTSNREDEREGTDYRLTNNNSNSGVELINGNVQIVTGL
ncbi:hypothetical protein OS493_028412 [Desmophyllum pertusum]|uniref:G-protein coupled receptors family 1 profile domain-containing protein n=1 Tax=Desmophyllum pertusum TaxID=174260 RepID=A0A9W9ZY04_9CNID|nr:hypothetical protein OS493_028412 [Desmophyllum pertusum]